MIFGEVINSSLYSGCCKCLGRTWFKWVQSLWTLLNAVSVLVFKEYISEVSGEIKS